MSCNNQERWPGVLGAQILVLPPIIISVQLLSHVRLFATPWIAARQASLSITNSRSSLRLTPKYSLEWLMLKLKLQYFGHLMQKVNLLEKTLIEGRRRREWQRTRWLVGITDSIDMSLSKLQELVIYREAWHPAVQGVAKIQIQLSDWTELNLKLIKIR